MDDAWLVTDRETLVALAHERADAGLAQMWISLLRPAIRLVPTALAPGAPVIARLGGRPHLPDDVEWPCYLGAPLPLVADVDLDAVACSGLDAGRPLPATGRLLCFRVTDDDERGIASCFAPESREGARLLHVPAGAPARETPGATHEYPELDLAGLQTWTWPREYDAPVYDVVAADEGEAQRLRDLAQAVDGRLWVTGGQWPEHRLGGWPQYPQTAVEGEAHQWCTGARDAPATELARWSLLLQLAAAEDLGMDWGDAGTLYWLTRGATGTSLGDLGHAWQF